MASITKAPKISSDLIDAITSNKIWGDKNLQYYFGDENTLSLDSEFKSEFKAEFTGSPDSEFAYIAVAEKAYRSLTAVTNLNLTETTSTKKADLVLVSSPNTIDDSLEGFFQFPGTSYRSSGDSWQIGAFNSGLDTMLASAEKGGGQYANWTILHEIGHSMGLLHTHSEDDGSPLPEVGVMDNERYSVMSYNGATNGSKYGHVVTYMALDIASLQALYGKDDYAEGTSSYRLTVAKGASLDLDEGHMSIGRAFACVWDTGGKDTISVSGGDYSVINLFDATLKTSGNSGAMARTIAAIKDTDYYDDLSSLTRKEITSAAYNAGGSFSQVLVEGSSGLKGNGGGYTIANGAVIENAKGGSGDDLLIGNEAKNFLYGGDGDDTILSSSGNDTMQGGGGADTFVFATGDGHDYIVGLGAGDIIDLSNLTGISSLKTFKSHAIDTDDGVLLTVGSNELLIGGIFEDDLVKDDFNF